MFDMLEHVYRESDAAHYATVARVPVLLKKPTPEKQAEYFRKYYRVHQMWVHKLLWCELCVDYSDAYLADIAGIKPMPVTAQPARKG